MPQTLLVTGFGPFENYPENPSGDIAETVHGRVVDGIALVGRRIVVSWREAWTAIRAAVEEVQPQALLCLGVAPDSFIRLEVLAKNASRPCLDVLDETPQLGPLLRIIEGAPAAYWTTLPVEWLRERLRQQQPAIAAELWSDAGSYLCNHVFFHLMHFLEGRVPHRGFIHVPRYPRAEDKGWPSRAIVLDAGVFLVEELAHWLALA
jgi:pyroglutamyl-peptidase